MAHFTRYLLSPTLVTGAEDQSFHLEPAIESSQQRQTFISKGDVQSYTAQKVAER
jgi:hypothetical protein